MIRRLAIALWLALVFGFLTAPLVVVAGASFGAGGRTAMIDFPPRALTWRWYLAIPADQLHALAAIQILERVVQDCLGAGAGAARQGVVEPVRPAHLLGGAENQLLV